eukprot:54923-Eustigmatos_ZCMA.PRE.1
MSQLKLVTKDNPLNLRTSSAACAALYLAGSIGLGINQANAKTATKAFTETWRCYAQRWLSCLHIDEG